jgi:hypothetical protein
MAAALRRTLLKDLAELRPFVKAPMTACASINMTGLQECLAPLRVIHFKAKTSAWLSKSPGCAFQAARRQIMVLKERTLSEL